MNKSLRQIIIGLIVLVVLPFIIILFTQINTLNENERIIEDAYNEQLETIIFSINQYSQDIVKDWRRDINNIILFSNVEGSSKYERIQNLFQNNKSVRAVFIIEDHNTDLHVSNTEEKDSISYIIEKLKPQIENRKNFLSNYLNFGYNKIEPLYTESNQLITLIFLVPDGKENTSVHGIVINSKSFVNENLAPKIREAVKEKFISVVQDTRDSSIVYSNSGDLSGIEIKNAKAFWLLPYYNIGISLKGETISNLVADRLSYNYWILILTSFVIIIAGAFVFLNIRKEMKLAQLKSDFVSNVSHELKTPLALISMFSETLEMDRIKSEEKKKEYYSIIHQETSRLTRIVSSILNFSKMEAGKRTYNIIQNNLSETIEQLISTYEFHLTNKGFDIKLNKDDVPEIKFDIEAISEVLINLIENAVKYSSDKKEIEINLGSEKDFVFFEVKDFGIGISKTEQTKIFDKFFRASSGDIHNTKGTGLGLSIVKNIVDAHSGKIELKSELGKGSAFKVLLPKNS